MSGTRRRFGPFAFCRVTRVALVRRARSRRAGHWPLAGAAGYRAATGAVVGLVAPHRLDGPVLRAYPQVLLMEVGALVAVLAGLVVVPAVLDHRLVVGVGYSLFELVASGEGVAVKVAVAERIVLLVD